MKNENQALGEQLSLLLGNASSAVNAKKVAEDVGFNDSPMFGARKRKGRLVGELVMANTALVFYAVNQVHEHKEAKEIIDSFLEKTNEHIFKVVEKDYPGFSGTYTKRMSEYYGALSGEQPALGISFLFIKNLDIDPLASLTGQLAIATRFGQVASQAIEMLQPSDQTNASQKRVEQANTNKNSLDAMEHFQRLIGEWPDGAGMKAMSILHSIEAGDFAGAKAALGELTGDQARIVVEFLDNLPAEELDAGGAKAGTAVKEGLNKSAAQQPGGSGPSRGQ